MKKERNQYLNILEAIAAYFVVFIHFPFPGAFGDAVVAIARFAVPFFYVVSGYFLYAEDEKTVIARIPRKVKRLARMVLISEVCYYLWNFILMADNYGISAHTIAMAFTEEFTNGYLTELPVRLLVFAPVFNGVGWFMTSLIVVYLIFTWTLKSGKLRAIGIIAIIGLIFGMVLRRVDCVFHFGLWNSYERFLLFIPLPFFTIGYYIGKWKEDILRHTSKTYLLVALSGIVLVLVEQATNNTHTLYAGTLLIVFGSFLYALKISPVKLGSIGRCFSMIGERCGTWIYILHNMIGWCACVIIPRLLPSVTETNLYHWMFPLIICVEATIASLAIYYCGILFRKIRVM